MHTFKRRLVSHISTALLVAIHLGCLLAFVVAFSWKLVALAAFGYVIRMWAITAGYHRYFAHRTYKTSRTFQLVLAVLGASAMQNGPLWWASFHRRHHKFTDGPLDPHSPALGFWHAHVGWFFLKDVDQDYSNIQDLLAYPELGIVERWSWAPVLAYGAGCYAIAGLGGLVWGFGISTVVCMHMTFFVNSLGHVWGTRRFETGDLSRNNALLALVTLGEGWHNNHHQFESSARQGLFWWEIDLSYVTLRALAAAGIVWRVRAPTRKAIAREMRGRGVEGRHALARAPALWPDPADVGEL